MGVEHHADLDDLIDDNSRPAEECGAGGCFLVGAEDDPVGGPWEEEKPEELEGGESAENHWKNAGRYFRT